MIELPFPPSSLSGHANGHWRSKSGPTAKYREWARLATLAAGSMAIPIDGDIRVIVDFYPPDDRGDRVNFPNRMKAYWDGVADALDVNDKRFLPEFRFFKAEKPGRVVIHVLA